MSATTNLNINTRIKKMLAASAVAIGVLASTAGPASAGGTWLQVVVKADTSGSTGGIPLARPIVGVQVEATAAGDWDGDGVVLVVDFDAQAANRRLPYLYT